MRRHGNATSLRDLRERLGGRDPARLERRADHAISGERGRGLGHGGDRLEHRPHAHHRVFVAVPQKPRRQRGSAGRARGVAQGPDFRERHLDDRMALDDARGRGGWLKLERVHRALEAAGQAAFFAALAAILASSIVSRSPTVLIPSRSSVSIWTPK